MRHAVLGLGARGSLTRILELGETQHVHLHDDQVEACLGDADVLQLGEPTGAHDHPVADVDDRTSPREHVPCEGEEARVGTGDDQGVESRLSADPSLPIGVLDVPAQVVLGPRLGVAECVLCCVDAPWEGTFERPDGHPPGIVLDVATLDEAGDQRGHRDLDAVQGWNDVRDAHDCEGILSLVFCSGVPQNNNKSAIALITVCNYTTNTIKCLYSDQESNSSMHLRLECILGLLGGIAYVPTNFVDPSSQN